MHYRVYLLGSDNRYQAAAPLCADDDRQAMEITMMLFDDCSTNFHGIELWEGPSLVIRRTTKVAWPKIDLEHLPANRRESVAKLAETLARGFQCVRESPEFMSALDRIRST